MLRKLKDNQRFRDKVNLTLQVSYFASFFAILFGLICTFILDIKIVVPYVFFVFGIITLLNTLAYKSHQNLTLTYNIISITGLVCSFLITLYTAGINSPFIFVMAVVVFAGYATTHTYGKIYLYITMLLVILLYLQGSTDFSFTRNVVPAQSQRLFSLLSVLFSVYILGGVLGKYLLKAHHNLYKTKLEVDERIREKETLLREVHHRVKNNLQTVSSLLSLQSRSIDNAQVRDLIKSSQNRVISMAIVHEMLYMREDLSKIEYKSYVQELCEYLLKSLKGMHHNVKLNIDIPDIQLGIDTAIPLGLLINEAVTNSLKYGIIDNDQGEIHIALTKEKDSSYQLFIGDDGIGFSNTITYKNSKSLGLKLINNLTRQLSGSISKDITKRGTNYIVRFWEVGQHPQFNSVAS